MVVYVGGAVGTVVAVDGVAWRGVSLGVMWLETGEGGRDVPESPL